MARQSTKTTLVRQWRLMELVRGSPQGQSIKDLKKALRASEATLESDLKILKEAGLPFTRTINSDESIVLYLKDTSSQSTTTATSDSNQVTPGDSPPDTRDSKPRRRGKKERSIPTLDIPSTLLTIDQAIQDETDLHLSYVLPGTTGVVSGIFVPYSVHTINKCHYLFAWDAEVYNYCLIEVARMTQIRQGAINTEGGYPYDGDQILSNIAEGDIGELITVSVMMAPWTSSLTCTYPLALTQTVQSLPDGRNIIRCQNVSSHEALRWVLSWGSDAEVLEPRSLRESIIGELRKSLATILKAKIDELKAERDSLALEPTDSN